MQNYEDDLSISDDELLLRRVMCKPDFTIVWDDNMSKWRASSAAFEDHPNGTPMSIALTSVLDELERPYNSILDDHEGFSLAAFPAGIARKNDQVIVREPTKEEPAHGVVFGKKSKRVKRNLAKASTWIVSPDDYT